MKRIPKKTKQVTFSLSPENISMINEILETSGFLSKSEVVRHAIRAAHKQQFPYYKVKAEKQAEEDAEWEALKALSNEDYAVQVLQADLKAKPGKAVLTKRDNTAWVSTIDLDKVKNFKSRNDVWADAGLDPEPPLTQT